MKNLHSRIFRFFGCVLVTAVILPVMQAADLVHSISTAGATTWNTAVWSPVGTPNAAGDIASYTGTTAGTTTLDVDATIGVLRNLGTGGPGTWTINADATPHAFTLDGTGLSAGNNPFGVAGEAAVSLSTNATFIVNPNITISNTNLGVGTTGNSPITLAGNITATTNQTISIRGGGSGGINLTGNIGQSGAGTIALSNANTGTSALIISGALGTSVTGVTQNSAGASVTVSGANTYTGTTTLTQGSLVGTTSTFSNTPLSPFGTSSLALNGGSVSLRAPGATNNSTVETVTFGNNVTVGGNTTITVQQSVISASTNSKTIALGNLSIGANTLTVTGANSYALQFAGATTLTGNATFNTTSANLTLGAVGGSGFGITKTGAGTLVINGASTYTGTTTINTGTVAVNGAAGSLAGTTALSATGNGTLQIGDAANGLANRVNTAATLTLGGSTGGGIATVFRGSATANSQSLASLTVGKGSNIINTNGTTGGAPTLTFSGASPYIRSVGGMVNLIDTSVTMSFTSAPSGAGNVGAGILVGAVKAGNDFVLAQSGNLTAPTYTNNTWASGNKTNVTVTSDFSATPSLTTDALRYNTAGTLGVTLAGTNTIQSGGILVGGTATGGTLTGGSIKTGVSGGDLWIFLNARPLTINSVIADNGTSGLTLGASTSAGGTLTLTSNNTYAGPTAVGGGILQIGNGGTTGDLGTGTSSLFVGTGGTVNYNRSNAYTLNSVTGGGTVNSNNATGVLTLNQVGSGLVLKSVGGVSGATVTFGGDGTGVTSVGDATSSSLNYMTTAGALYKFTSGTVNLLDNARGFASNIEVAGGTLNLVNNNLSMSGINGGTQTFTLSSGTINSQGSFGVSGLNGNGGPSIAGLDNSTFIGTQTGGTFNITAASGRFDLGSISSNDISTYTLAGGTINHAVGSGGFRLGADTAGTSTTTFNFSGGKLIENVSISGLQGAGAKQAFVWTGGTLAAFLFDATNLTSTSGTAVVLNSTNTLTNNGGILAPGDIGTAGKTQVTGNYNIASPTASYSVDIGGTAAASVFQAGSGAYDQTVVIGATVLGGRLNFNFINGYAAPANTTTLFSILRGNIAATSTVTGTFTNQVTATGGNSRVVGADGLSSFLIAINNTAATATTGGLTSVAARNVSLGGYQATNTYSGAGTAWDTTNAGAWTNFDPGATASPGTQASNAIAQFSDGTASTGVIAVSLNSTRNIQGVQFASAAGSRAYSINNGGSGAIILDNTGNAAAATIADTSTSGTANAINVPVTLKSNLGVSVSNAANNLTIGGAIGETLVGATLAKTGAGTLILTGTNTYTGGTTISAGKLQLGAGGTTGSLSTTGAIVNNGNLTINRSNAVTQGTDFNGAAITGAGSLTQAGSGTTTLNAANTYSGGTTVSGGTLALAGSGTYGTGSLTVSGGTANLGTKSITNTLGTLTGGGSVTNGTITNNSGTYDLQNGTVSAILAGSNGVAKSTAGTVTLSGANTYSGGTTITGGLIAFNDLASFGTGALTLNGGGVQWASGYTGGDISTRTVTIASGNGTFDTNGNNITLAGSIGNSGSGQLIKTGSGSLSIGTLSSTGGTSVQGGSLTIGSGGASGNIATSSGTTTNFGSTSTYSDVISGTGTVAITGGNVNFTGTNTYTGPTNVTGGTFRVNGSLANSTVTVGSGATLGGSGSFGGATTVQSGGTLAPGNSPGIQTFASGLTLETGSNFSFELIANSSSGRGTIFDGVNVTGGTFTLQSGVSFNITLNGSGSSTDFTNAFWSSNQSWLVFQDTNAPSIVGSFVLGSVSNDSLAQSFASTGGSFGFTQVGNDILLTYSAAAIPEPATCTILFGAAAFGFVSFRRRRANRR